MFFLLLILISFILAISANSPEVVKADIDKLPDTGSAKFITYDFIQTELDVRRQTKQRKLVLAEEIRKTEGILAQYNSPMRGYGEIIVNKARECGGDYRVLLAIAGNESGFGRIPYKLYNPFGYLDRVQYTGWEQSLSVLSCRISQQYLSRCNNDLRCIVTTGYGGPDTDIEKWIGNIQFFINQINSI